MSIAVTGGAGYIGSCMVHLLRERGMAVAVVDDLSTGHRDNVPPDVPLLVSDIRDAGAVAAFLREHRVEALIHFAARALVGESVADPRLYWNGNVAATVALLEAALDAGVRRVVFSSTCAVYGVPRVVPIDEDTVPAPINPYGESKLAIERMLGHYDRAYGLRYAALRYFNAAGAWVEKGLGERHRNESHLVPLVLQVASGLRPHVTVLGSDYPTPDGTCIRDYIHVRDLADAHLAALTHLARGGPSGSYNLGTGQGCSVRQVIEAARRITGRDITVVEGPRRPGDPPALVAQPRRAQETLGWKAGRSSLEQLLLDAWAWHGSRETLW